MTYVVLLRPFHLIQLENVYQSFKLIDQNIIIFHNHLIPASEIINIFPLSKPIGIPQNEFYLKDIVQRPIKQIRNIRVQIKKLKTFILENISSEHPKNLILFHEKGIFTQLLTKNVLKLNSEIKISLIDEGTAFYVNDKFHDRLLKVVYKLFSTILFGFQFEYFKRAGVSKHVDIIYIRYPQYVIKKKHIKYLKIPLTSCKEIEIKEGSKIILIISSPLSEQRILKSYQEQQMFANIFPIIKSNFNEIHCKLHPSESFSKFENHKHLISEFITGFQSIGDLDLNKYHYIINFGSSIVLDLLDLKYPSKRIITYNMVKSTKGLRIFDETINLESISDVISFFELDENK